MSHFFFFLARQSTRGSRGLLKGSLTFRDLHRRSSRHTYPRCSHVKTCSPDNISFQLALSAGVARDEREPVLQETHPVEREGFPRKQNQWGSPLTPTCATFCRWDWFTWTLAFLQLSTWNVVYEVFCLFVFLSICNFVYAFFPNYFFYFFHSGSVVVFRGLFCFVLVWFFFCPMGSYLGLFWDLGSIAVYGSYMQVL